MLDDTERARPVLKEAVLMRSFMEDEKTPRARDSQHRLFLTVNSTLPTLGV